MVERLDLVPVKGKIGGDKILSEWVTLSYKYQLPWEKKCLGLLAIWLSLELPKKSCCSSNLFNNLDDMHFIIPLGHRGPVVSPRSIGPGRAGTQTFYYPVIWYNNKIMNLYINVEERPVPQFFPFVQVKHLTKEAKAKLKGP